MCILTPQKARSVNSNPTVSCNCKLFIFTEKIRARQILIYHELAITYNSSSQHHSAHSCIVCFSRYKLHWSVVSLMRAGVRLLTIKCSALGQCSSLLLPLTLSHWLLLINVTHTNNGKAQLRLTNSVLSRVWRKH